LRDSLYQSFIQENQMLKTQFADVYTIPEIGIDEAGRGPLWGPLTAAAVYWPPEHAWTDRHRELAPKIQDSKKISAKKREGIAKQIKELSIAYGVGIVMPDEIDNQGASWANQTAFRRAISAIQEDCSLDSEVRFLIDGILPLADLKEKEEQQLVIDGDATYLSIAAASIIAKVEHDTWVVNWCKEHVAEAAKYDLLSCKGYGTAKHRDGIKKYGYTDLHRRLYLRKMFPDIVVKRLAIVQDN
jgi:ribonuclease HII